jgi:hypothetical protein
VIALLAIVLSSAGLPASDSDDSLPALKVDGNRLKTIHGKDVRMQGVNIPGLEWDEWQHVMPTLKAAVGEWKANIVRLPLSQDHWFGRAKEQKDRGAGYRKIVRAFAEQAAALKCYVILDLEVPTAAAWVGNTSLGTRCPMTGVLSSGKTSPRRLPTIRPSSSIFTTNRMT